MPEVKRDGVQTSTIGVREELGAANHIVTHLFLTGGAIELTQGFESLWMRLRTKSDAGVVLRIGYLLGNPLHEVKSEPSGGFTLQYASGSVRVTIEAKGEQCLRVRTWVTPKVDLILPYIPRDLYPVDEQGDPSAIEGELHTSQAGLNMPMVYFSLRKPAIGSFFYFQNLTSLNEYFETVKQTPNGAVGGKWPELGYLTPVSATVPLPAGRELPMTDTFLLWSEEIPDDPRSMTSLFVDFVRKVYPLLEPHPPEQHDWQALAKEALSDLGTAPTASDYHFGHRYLHPYNDAEYPDSAIQLNVLHGLADYASWRGAPIPLQDELREGVDYFYDSELKTMRRYLPDVGKDKNRDEVDSWYMYHPLMSLARLARYGDGGAREMLFQSLDTAIRFAHKFEYQWPVLFHLVTGEVIRESRREGEPGQSDVAGLYAYVMLLVHELTGEDKYVDEAKKSLLAVKDYRFELAYQTNITAWGVPACIRAYNLTQDEYFLKQADVFLACFLRHTVLWESEIENAKHYSVFFGACCLDNGPYLAVFEGHEAFEALTEALTEGQEVLRESARFLLGEYFKYTLSHAWYFHPRFLPKEAIAKEIRNGSIDPNLAFPLEDLYVDGKPAGQVGQEVYGCGVSFAMVTHAYHHLADAPFVLFCEYPIRDLEVSGQEARFRILGSRQGKCRVRFEASRKSLPPIQVEADGETRTFLPTAERAGEGEIVLEGEQQVVVRWR